MKRATTARALGLDGLPQLEQRRDGDTRATPRCDEHRDVASRDPAVERRVTDSQQVCREASRHGLTQLLLERKAHSQEVMIGRQLALHAAEAGDVLEESLLPISGHSYKIDDFADF